MLSIFKFELVRTLELGLVTKCAVLCVSSLTLCTMEMQAVMKRQANQIRGFQYK